MAVGDSLGILNLLNSSVFAPGFVEVQSWGNLINVVFNVYIILTDQRKEDASDHLHASVCYVYVFITGRACFYVLLLIYLFVLFFSFLLMTFICTFFSSSVLYIS